VNLLRPLTVAGRKRGRVRAPTGAEPLGPGRSVGRFAARTLDGIPITWASFASPTLVGFFSAHCPASAERLPGFLALAGGMPGRQAQVLAVAVGTPEETACLRNQLDDVATVLVDADHGHLVRAFGIRGYPTFAVVGADGMVVSSGYDASQVALPVPP